MMKVMVKMMLVVVMVMMMPMVMSVVMTVMGGAGDHGSGGSKLMQPLLRRALRRDIGTSGCGSISG